MAAVVGKRKLGTCSAVIRCCSDSMGGTPWCHQHILFPLCKAVRGGKPPLYPALSEDSPVCLLLAPLPASPLWVPRPQQSEERQPRGEVGFLPSSGCPNREGRPLPNAWASHRLCLLALLSSLLRVRICAFSPACTRTEGEEASPRCCVEFRTF